VKRNRKKEGFSTTSDHFFLLGCGKKIGWDFCKLRKTATFTITGFVHRDGPAEDLIQLFDKFLGPVGTTEAPGVFEGVGWMCHVCHEYLHHV